MIKMKGTEVDSYLSSIVDNMNLELLETVYLFDVPNMSNFMNSKQIRSYFRDIDTDYEISTFTPIIVKQEPIEPIQTDMKFVCFVDLTQNPSDTEDRLSAAAWSVNVSTEVVKSRKRKQRSRRPSSESPSTKRRSKKRSKEPRANEKMDQLIQMSKRQQLKITKHTHENMNLSPRRLS